MAIQNCWEFTECGREPGGARALESGVCQATVAHKANHINRGLAAGRACWAVSGTYSPTPDCDRVLQGARCVQCDFYQVVRREEGADFIYTANILAQLHARGPGEAK